MFLLRLLPDDGRIGGQYDLHSNMFLLRLEHPAVHFPVPFLFTFQYVSIKTEIRNNVKREVSWFTFQYVSIKTWTGSRLRQHKEKFTFQYVSIKTDGDANSAQLKEHLHSNMFLLRHRFAWPANGADVIYIPICFY